MNLILCLDDRNGLQFNNRRQSRDSLVCSRILKLAEGSVLWMKPASAKLFDKVPATCRVEEACADRVGAGEFYFAENVDFLPMAERIQTVFVFRWNRVYPADVQLGKTFLEENFSLVKTEDFPGNSHKRITLEVYNREN